MSDPFTVGWLCLWVLIMIPQWRSTLTWFKGDHVFKTVTSFMTWKFAYLASGQDRPHDVWLELKPPRRSADKLEDASSSTLLCKQIFEIFFLPFFFVFGNLNLKKFFSLNFKLIFNSFQIDIWNATDWEGEEEILWFEASLLMGNTSKMKNCQTSLQNAMFKKKTWMAFVIIS